MWSDKGSICSYARGLSFEYNIKWILLIVWLMEVINALELVTVKGRGKYWNSEVSIIWRNSEWTDTILFIFSIWLWFCAAMKLGKRERLYYNEKFIFLKSSINWDANIVCCDMLMILRVFIDCESIVELSTFSSKVI